MTKVVIEAAVNGITIPTQSPYLPINPDDIVQQIVEAYRAGAAIAHFHTRESYTGMPAIDAQLYRKIMVQVKEQCDIVLCPAIETSLSGTFQERLAFVHDCQPEMVSINMGPNLNPSFRLLKEFPVLKQTWERSYLEQSYDMCASFSYETMETYGRTLIEYGTMPEIEIHDTGDINNLVWMLNEGLIKRPLYLQFILDVGLRLTVDYVVHLFNTAKIKLSEFNFALSGTNEEQMVMAGVSLALGGYARVGLGDSVKSSRGKLVKSCAEQVSNAYAMVEGLGYEVATANEAREMLGLKGLAAVNF